MALAVVRKNVIFLSLQSKVFHNYSSKVITNSPNLAQELSKPVIKSYGQPAWVTHPHLLKEGEVTPCITVNEFQERRQRLLDFIVRESHNEVLKKHIIVIPSASKQYMSDKIPYVFRQNTDFLYLTGCLEPDSCLVLATTNSPGKHLVTLFVRPKDEHAELWDGHRTGVEEAVNLFGVEQALPVTELGTYIQSSMKSNQKTMLWWYDYVKPIQQSLHKVMEGFIREQPSKMLESPTEFIHLLRVIKSPAEISLMQKSCNIASDAIAKTIKFSQPGHTEHQIFANVEYECKMKGADYLAYPPVVAGGNRANVIHYISNNQVVQDGEMVLMDAGCEYHGYSSDITRTWPINGKFSLQQAAVYDAVLRTQQELIEMCSSFPTLDSLFNAMCLLLGTRLQSIGLVPQNISKEAIMKAAYEFCPHHVSHYLGMDVHDTSSVSRSINIEPGMVVTVEPGVYISHKHRVPKEFQGIGIRIEDDVLITKNGPVVLTEKCPKVPADIERLASEN